MGNTSPEIGKKIRDKALSHLGEHEQPSGSNRGPEVERYLDYVGLEGGNPWCAAFASYCTGTTLEQSGLKLTHVHSGSSSAIVSWGMQHGQIIARDKVQSGDLYILEGGDGPKAADGKQYFHTAVVNVVTTAGIHTIEGNYKNSVAGNIREWGKGKFVRPFVI